MHYNGNVLFVKLLLIQKEYIVLFMNLMFIGPCIIVIVEE